MQEATYQFIKMCHSVKTYFVFTLLLHIKAQDINRPCALRNGSSGICGYISTCKSAQKELQQKLTPIMCGFEGISPIVCCEDDTSITQRTAKRDISEEKCHEYRQLNIKTTITTTTTTTTPKPNKNYVPFVVGGVDALFEEFPHMALLGYGKSGNIEFKCGGSLISNQFVLTAAHCLESRDFGPVSRIRLGDLDVASDTEPAEPQDFDVAEVYPHPDYDFPSFYNDIALIKLNRTVTYTKYVKPACLQSKFDLEDNDLTATGWGALLFGGDFYSTLQKGYLSNLPIKNCLPTYGPQARLSRGIDEELQICGGNLEKTVDTCQGDSGGPLQLKTQDFPLTHRVVGVTSFGTHCGLVPAIYTRVSHYISWIESIVWPN